MCQHTKMSQPDNDQPGAQHSHQTLGHTAQKIAVLHVLTPRGCHHQVNVMGVDEALKRLDHLAVLDDELGRHPASSGL
jgi:hypothetical protein